MNTYKRCLLLLSGGLDSTIAAYWLKEQGYIIEALYFDFGLKQMNSERDCAVSIAKQLGIKIKIVETPLPSEALRIILPYENNDYAQLMGDMVNMCIMAATFAVISGIDSIILGLNTDNKKVHPALHTRFFRLLEKLTSLWIDNNLKFLVPFIDKDKLSIMRIGVELGVPFKSTWSCSANVDKHCGKCSDCLSRKEVFIDVGLKDHTEYEY